MERNTGNNGADFRAPERFRHPVVTIDGDKSVVPFARENEVIGISLTPFQDHGRPAFVGSAIRHNSALAGIASELSKDDTLKLTEALGRTMEVLLDSGSVRSDGVMKSDREGRPDIHVLNVGNSFNDRGLRLYFHVAEFQKARVIIQDARTTVRNAERVERVLRRDGGYQSPRGWENSVRNRGRG